MKGWKRREFPITLASVSSPRLERSKVPCLSFGKTKKSSTLTTVNECLGARHARVVAELLEPSIHKEEKRSKNQGRREQGRKEGNST